MKMDSLPRKAIVGIESVNYTNKKGAVVTGVRLHCIEIMTSPHIGHKAFDVYISSANVAEYHLGEYVTLLYEPGYNGQVRCNGVLYTN